eukprot:TRINITY_DN2436_c0_g1_i4.p3 TRINITY_DN2436_c0_g1~~TRINITY_DN2436_c0_g1_i4.p3  ORF type:complete len:113 (+),score=7.46 TRINITY_DN2436_c0_g1_i4:226-564(+)
MLEMIYFVPKILYKQCAQIAKVAPATTVMSRSPTGYTYQYPRPALTVDTIIISKGKEKIEQPQVLLIQRKHPPCQGQWALPGGFVDEFEPLDKAALRARPSCRSLERELGRG